MRTCRGGIEYTAGTYHTAAGHADSVGIRQATLGTVDDRPVEGGIEAESYSTAVESTRVRSCEGKVIKGNLAGGTEKK